MKYAIDLLKENLKNERQARGHHERLDGPCPTCGKYSLDCTCGLFDSKENESMESHQERKELYELNSIRDESLHIQPYADMIDKLTYVQKADFAKRALELERDCATYKKMFEEVSRERNAWILEYRVAREEVERLKQERKQIIEENASQAMKISFLEPYKERYEYAIIDGTDLRQKLEQQEELLNKEIGRACALEEWLTEYRDQLKKENVYHKNQGIINAINELLNETSTNI